MPKGSLRPYSMTIVALAIGIGTRLVFEPWLDGAQTWATFYPALALAAWFGGRVSALLCTAMFIAIGWVWLVPMGPYDEVGAAIGTIVFALGGVGFAFVAGVVQRSRDLERERAERARAETRRIAAIVATVPFPVCLLQMPGGRIVQINPAYERVLGWSQDELLGKTTLDIHSHVTPEIRQRYLAQLFEEGAVRDLELELLTKSGEPRLMRCSTSLVELDGERFAVASMEDITEQRRASRAKDEFLAMLGHELRNPLAPILTALEVMRMRDARANERERAVIERQVRHMVRLVDDLLDVSRIARGQIELRKKPIELAKVLARAVEMVSPLLEERRHQFQLALPDGATWVDGDATRLAQVFTNLLVNAAKYTPAEGSIRIDVVEEAQRVLVSVSDTGEGIPAELLPHVFDLFVQGERSSDRKQGGLGVGLAVVRSVVTLHGGDVRVASAPGKGSVVTVELPVIESPRVADAAELVQTSPRAPARILVVDDNTDAATLLGDLLATAGHDVRVAHDGPQALELVGKFRPNIAILDIGLPVMDGYELAAELRRRDPAIRLMAVTGYGQLEDRQRSAHAGFEAHFVKPIGVSKLMAEIDTRA